MAKGVSKRETNKKDMDKVNRTALVIGGGVALAILLAIIVSFYM